MRVRFPGFLLVWQPRQSTKATTGGVSPLNFEFPTFRHPKEHAALGIRFSVRPFKNLPKLWGQVVPTLGRGVSPIKGLFPVLCGGGGGNSCRYWPSSRCSQCRRLSAGPATRRRPGVQRHLEGAQNEQLPFFAGFPGNRQIITVPCEDAPC